MITLVSKDQCCGCHACAAVCPKACITMVEDAEGFLYPRADAAACVECGLCERVCPLKNTSRPDETRVPTAYAAWNTDEEVRRTSSSGGVFTAVAEWILDQGGVVFGAAFDGAENVRHIAVEDKNDLGFLRGSKYLQSRIGDSYRRAEEYLKAGRTVLFSGTPCQIGGLRAYLGRDYENLICQDLVCHGVPSSVVWRKALKEYENDANAAVTGVFFRSKSTGWRGYSLSLTFADGGTREIPHKEETFMRAFLADLCLRPSCYACGFKGLSRASDITLADFWGIEQVLPSMDNDKGTSLVFVHSERGARLLQEIADRVEVQTVDAAEAARHNAAMLRSVSGREKKAAFMKDIKALSLAAAVNKHTRPTFVRRCKRAVKRVVSLISKKDHKGKAT